jgi:hypothetical protein
MPLPDPDEERRFAEIVAEFRARRRARVVLLAGVALCLAAIALIAFGGVEGAVLAVIPWLVGIIMVVRSRARH